MATTVKVAPMPTRGRKLSLGFGLVNVPVHLKPIAETQRPIAGKGLCPTHGPTLSQIAQCCAGTPDEHLVPNDEKQIGYPHPDKDGEYVVVDPVLWKALEEDRTGTAAIERIVDAESIDPAYIDKTYLAWPQQGFEQQFDLLAAVLDKEGKAAIVTTVLSKQTQLLAFRFSVELGCLVAHVIHFEQKLRHEDVELVRRAAKDRPELDERMLAAAAPLLDALVGEFDASEAQDMLTGIRQDAIRAAAKGKVFKLPTAAPEPVAGDDVMAALLASVQATTPKKKPAAKKPAGRKKVAA